MKRKIGKSKRIWDRCDRLSAGMIAVSPLMSKLVEAGQMDELEKYMDGNFDRLLVQVKNAKGMFAVVDWKRRSAWAFESLAEAMEAFEPEDDQFICPTKVEDGKAFVAIGGTFMELANVNPKDGQNRICEW